MAKTTYQQLRTQHTFSPPADWWRIRTIDLHTGGEPLRVILEGFPELRGNSVLEYRRDCRDRFDHLRRALLFEPRGHADMYGALPLPPNDAEGDFGLLFLHNEGYSTMCGHAIIAIATLAVELNWVKGGEGEIPLSIDAPCGRIKAYARVAKGRVRGVRFHCVPSFVVGLDRTVDVPGWGRVTYDLAYGGAFYAYVELSKNRFDFDLGTAFYRTLIEAGMAIKRAVAQHDPDIQHPFEAELSFLYGTIFIDPRRQASGCDSKNVCIFAEGEVDRCPTGSGVSGRMAIHHRRGELAVGENLRIESITGSVFRGSVVEVVDYGPYSAVIPEVEGTAHITGTHTFVIDPDDPMREGFLLR
ncbi:MAG: proline racemase family protein [Bacteroidota bacterium]